MLKHPIGLNSIAKKFQLRQIILFGSQATGQTTSASDFDIGIMAGKPLTAPQQEQLLIELSQKLKLPIQKIDLTMLNHSSPLLLYESVKDSRLLYGRKNDLIKLKLYAIKQYQDYHKFYQSFDKYLTRQYA